MSWKSMLRSMATTAAPLVRNVNVVYLYVSDMERSAAFYRDLLGIPLEGDDDWQEARLGGTPLRSPPRARRNRRALLRDHSPEPRGRGRRRGNRAPASSRCRRGGDDARGLGRRCSRPRSRRVRAVPVPTAAMTVEEDYSEPVLEGDAPSGLRALPAHRRAALAAEDAGAVGAPRRAALPDRPPVLGAVVEARAGRRWRRRRGCWRRGKRMRPSACSAAPSGCMRIVNSLLDMLEQMSPWEYTRYIRPVLGHGSGFDSPGFRNIRRVSPEPWRGLPQAAPSRGSVDRRAVPARARVRAALPARRAADRVGRAGRGLARAPLQGGRARDRGQGGRHAGDAGRAPRQADQARDVSRALARSQRADDPREGARLRRGAGRRAVKRRRLRGNRAAVRAGARPAGHAAGAARGRALARRGDRDGRGRDSRGRGRARTSPESTSPSRREIARRAPRAKGPPIDFERGDVQELRFEDGRSTVVAPASA